MIYNVPYIASFILIVLGLSALIFKKNLLKMVIGVILIQNGINLFIVTIGYINETTYDTFPQFLAFTNIIIGVGIISIMLSIIIQIYKKYHTLNINKLGGK